MTLSRADLDLDSQGVVLRAYLKGVYSRIPTTGRDTFGKKALDEANTLMARMSEKGTFDEAAQVQVGRALGRALHKREGKAGSSILAGLGSLVQRVVDQHEGVLHLVLDVCDELAHLPWELVAADTLQASPLIHEAPILVTRGVPGLYTPAKAPRERPCLLLARASAVGEREAERVTQIWRHRFGVPIGGPDPGEHDVVLTVLDPKIEELRESIQRGPPGGGRWSGLHLIFHGEPGALELREGLLEADRLANLVRGKVEDFVYLSSCHSEDRQAEPGAPARWQGTARVIAANIGHVICFRGKLHQSDSLTAADSWYHNRFASGDQEFEASYCARQALLASDRAAGGQLVHFHSRS